MAPHHHRILKPGAAIPHPAQLAPAPALGQPSSSFGEEDGSSLVEFALTLPMFMLVITGVLYFGIVLFNYITLTEATQFATRQLMISRGQTLDPCALFTSTFYNSAPTLNPSNLTFSFTLNGASYPSTTSCPGTATSGAPSNMVVGANATVTVTYPAKLALVSDVISPGFTLTAQELEQIQ